MSGYEDRISFAAEALNRAEYIVIGGGAGLSAAAGIDYGGARFEKYFADYMARYGIADMYSGMFYNFASPEEEWAHHARHILVNRFEQDAADLYKNLFGLVGNKNYFVITTNVESQFVKSGFGADRIFEVQGNYAYIQCAAGCHDKLYYDEAVVREMCAAAENFRVPRSLVPVCPECGGKMSIHVRTDAYFVQNADWYAMSGRYTDFVRSAAGKRELFLELGVGYNTPGIIRYPFERAVFTNKNAFMIRLNRDYPQGLPENAVRTISFDENMSEVIDALCQMKNYLTD